MSKTTTTTTLSAALPDFLTQIQEAANQDAPERDIIRQLSVYNVNKVKGEKLDKDKAGKLFIGKHSEGEVYCEPTQKKEGTILLVRKYFDGFLPSINPLKSDYYYSNYMDIFSKGPIFLKGNVLINPETEERVSETQGFRTIDEFRKAISSPLGNNGEPNKFFHGMKKPLTGGAEYPTSKINLQYKVWFRDNETGEIFEINPKASYGKYSKPVEGTIEFVKKSAEALLKTAHLDYKAIELSMFDVSLSCIKDEENNVYKFNWELIGFTQKDPREDITKCRDIVAEINANVVNQDSIEKKEEVKAISDGLEQFEVKPEDLSF